METMKFSPTFLCLLLSVILESTVRAYYPSSGGSASGDLFVFECKIPPYSDRDRISVNPTDEEFDQIVKEGRCYLACVTKEYQVANMIHGHTDSHWLGHWLGTVIMHVYTAMKEMIQNP